LDQLKLEVKPRHEQPIEHKETSLHILKQNGEQEIFSQSQAKNSTPPQELTEWLIKRAIFPLFVASITTSSLILKSCIKNFATLKTTIKREINLMTEYKNVTCQKVRGVWVKIN
jgi:hypothetical protein